MGKHKKHRRHSSDSGSEIDRKKYRPSKRYEEDRHKNEDKFEEIASSSSKQADRTDDYENFTFLDYKSDLNRVINWGTDLDKLIYDIHDFWPFVTKYETLLIKSGKSVIQKSSDSDCKTNNFDIPSEYSKTHCINLKLHASTDELFAKMPPYDEDYDKRRPLTRSMFKQFIDIVVLYLDFKNREKFTKLKKLRKFQSELPVAEYR